MRLFVITEVILPHIESSDPSKRANESNDKGNLTLLACMSHGHNVRAPGGSNNVTPASSFPGTLGQRDHRGKTPQFVSSAASLDAEAESDLSACL